MSQQFKREPLTSAEANQLAQACQTHQERLTVWTLLDTGLRVSEFCQLTRASVDWQAHRVMVYGKGGPFGSKSKRRVIPLTSRVAPLLEGHLSLNDGIGMTPRTVQRILKRVANRAHVSRKVTPHVLRHTFSVACVQKGISLPTLQRLLGHDRLATTEIYLNLSPEHVVDEFRAKW
jgi:integrase/recombinase XerD